MADEDFLEELCGVSSSVMETAKEDDRVILQSLLVSLERALIETKPKQITALQEQLEANQEIEAAAIKSAFPMARLICEGRYADVIRSERGSALLKNLVQRMWASGQAADDAQQHICSTITHHLEAILLAEPADEKDQQRIGAVYEIFLVGVAFFNVYVQANYTGPAFDNDQVEDILTVAAQVICGNNDNHDNKNVHRNAVLALQVDGESPFSICHYPQFLLMGRCLLDFVGNYTFANWSFANQANGLEEEDATSSRATSTNSEVEALVSEVQSAAWWNARAAVAHGRLLLAREPSNTLWYEAKRGYLKTIKNDALYAYKQSEYLLARAHVEWGLAQHHFDKNKMGKRSFEEAKEVSGVSVQMSGSMGKRTKFQQKATAQMVLLAASKYAPEEDKPSVYANAVAASTHADFGGKKVEAEGDSETNPDGLTKEELAVQKMVQDGDATYRDINLDQVDQDNILLEQISFEDKTMTEQGNLQTMDQVVLLALCLDVKNSNANDGLTREQMFPYVTRVLENPNNWMVYSTGLLERAWLECETSKRRERAVLQMQALVDQHTTRLTVTQNTMKMIEDAAPAHERMEFVYALAFPPRYGLKQDLAERYFGLGVFGSAVEIYEEMEMWDDVVKCYQILDKPNKTEKLVRERLKVAPTPFMWCCLGDVTQDISHYETAWELSKHRFARAKRSLGRHFFEAGELPTAIIHYKESVEVSPMNTSAWFVLGSMSMRTQDWDFGLRAFTRVVQLEPDNGEAWGNIGSIHMHNHHFNQAFSVLQEALKQKRHMWQMWENYSYCAMEIEKYGEAMYGMHQLLDLRSKHNRPIDSELLAWLVEAIVYENKEVNAQQEDAAAAADEPSQVVLRELDAEEEDIVDFDESATATDRTPPRSNANYKKQLAMLFGRITSVVTNNAKVWQVYAHFNDGTGRTQKALDCRLKECRALQKAGWETEEASVDELCKAAVRLAKAYMQEGTKKALYSCRLYIRGVLKKAQVDYESLPTCQELAATLEQVDAMEKQL